MKYKKEILKSPMFMLVIIAVIILAGMIIVKAILNVNDTKIIDEKNTIDVIGFDTNMNYDFTKLKRNGDYLSYEDNNYYSMLGIDVSTHQDYIDWQKVKNSGIEFVFIRLGYRGAVEGKLNIDSEFENYYKGAIDSGLKVGVYWYAQPASEKESIEEAQFVLGVLNERHLDFPIVYDFEETEFEDGSLSRMHGMSKENRTKMAVAFCEEMKKNGKDIIIYTYPFWSDNYYDWSKLDEYPIWYAQYDDIPDYDRSFVMWQYTDSGIIDGIDTPVDLDLLFIKKNGQN